MRKAVLFLAVLGLVTVRSFAQTSIELIPQAGYTFPSRTDFYDTYGRIAGSLNLGGAIKFNVSRSFGIEFLYNHMGTSSGLYQYGYDGQQLAGGNLNIDYIMAGFVQSFGIPNSTVRPFIGVLLGAAVFTPQDYTSDTRFAAGVQLGTNIYISPRVGIQLKAQLLAPVDAAGSSFYFSNYGGGGGISTYSSVYQFGLNGGLIIGLGRILPEQVYHRPRPRPRYYRYYPY
jgi:hypothetical protein